MGAIGEKTVPATALNVNGMGVKGSDFYLHNPWFHGKFGAFVLAALLSIYPTLAFLRWRKAAGSQPDWRPNAAEVSRVRMVIKVEFALIALIFVLAAGMARYGGLGL